MEQLFDLGTGESVDVIIDGHRLMSVVRDVPMADVFVMTLPAARGVSVTISTGQLVNVIYYKQSGIFSFVALIDRMVTFSGESCVELVLKSPITKCQRRDFIRVDATIPARTRVLAVGEPESCLEVEAFNKQRLGLPRPPSAGQKVYELTTVDLSGGGVSLVSDTEITEGSILEIGLELTKESVVYIDAIVTRSYNTDGKGKTYMISAQFINVDEQIRRRVIKYVFRKNRNALKHDA